MQSQDNEFVWMRSYDKPETLETYEACPERAEYSPLVGKCIVKTELRVGIEELVANESPVRTTRDCRHPPAWPLHIAHGVLLAGRSSASQRSDDLIEPRQASPRVLCRRRMEETSPCFT